MGVIFPFYVVPLIKAVSKSTGVATILPGDAFIVSSTSVEIFRAAFFLATVLQAKKVNAIKMYFMMVL